MTILGNILANIEARRPPGTARLEHLYALSEGTARGRRGSASVFVMPAKGFDWIPAPRFREDKLRGNDRLSAF